MQHRPGSDIFVYVIFRNGKLDSSFWQSSYDSVEASMFKCWFYQVRRNSFLHVLYITSSKWIRIWLYVRSQRIYVEFITDWRALSYLTIWLYFSKQHWWLQTPFLISDEESSSRYKSWTSRWWMSHVIFGFSI